MNFLAMMALKATVILALAYLMAAALARRSASARHLVWTGAMAASLALPVLSLALPNWPAEQAHSTTRAAEILNPPAKSAPPVAVAPARAKAPAPPVWLILWAVGAAAVLARMLAGLGRAVWIVRRSEHMRFIGLDGLPRRTIRVLKSERTSMPLTFGVWRPVILLPEAVRDWTEERLRVVLQHEVAHVIRLDWLTQAMAQLACALYWFHPLVWMAAARQRREREQASDDRVLALGIGGPEYAGHLLELARSLQPSAAWPMEVAMAQASDLESRLSALLDTRRDRRAVGGKTAVFATGFAVAAAALLAPGVSPAQNAVTSLSGIVTDASRARVPKAMVTAVSAGAKTKEVAVTDRVGAFQFSGLAAGNYTLIVESPGFKRFERHVTVSAGTAAQADATLVLGQILENVEVTGKRTQPAIPAGAPQRIRVGGNVQAGRLISKVNPVYPQEAQDRGVEGAVMLNAVIGTDGGLMSVTPVNSLVDPALIHAALDAVRLWRYQPSLLNGVPVEVVTTITVNFRLAP